MRVKIKIKKLEGKLKFSIDWLNWKKKITKGEINQNNEGEIRKNKVS